MNKAALANFLRHLLFLFVILKFVSGVILTLQSSTCEIRFREKILLPLTLDRKIVNTIFLSVNIIFTFYTSIGVMIILISVVGFVGAVCLNSHQLINFAAGASFLFIAPFEFIAMFVLGSVLSSFEFMIVEAIEQLFASSNAFLLPLDRWNPDSYNMMFSQPFDVYGWNMYVVGGKLNHSYIDFLQTTLKCCGISGRYFWEVPVPKSCCSDNYPGDECTTMVANSKHCLKDYGRFKGCVLSIEYQSFFFGVLSVATALVSLYLARLRVKFPDGNYVSEHSSSEEEETSFFT